ncbi:XdhC family protein [Gordonia liuliyuniae]|uniref:XdhC family protein n=1 Tax=Gordonia liuliyuniae TaxID=2911517 RepID=A0ABS9IYA4_9ACTN|nr:XdhC/CoxI family protein [Gordonia liuliyuniae]MCF8590541.1 XdhC family protein [Gordonia liuliyuniae]
MPSAETVWDALQRWYACGEPAALARVVHTSSSAPRGLGAAMGVTQSGQVVGSLSGGCIEGDVVALAQEVIDSGTPVTSSYSSDTEDAFAPGLPCGGTVDVFVEPVDSSLAAVLPTLMDSVRDGDPVALATVMADAGPRRHLLVGARQSLASLGDSRLDHAAIDDVRGLLASGTTRVVHLGVQGQRRHDELAVFVQSFGAPPRMLIFGANDFAAALSGIGQFLGYRVTVCDARSTFATAERFPDADEVIVGWPHHYLAETQVDASTAICVLTHDPKFDVPVLEVALRTDAGYIGVMGSRRTHADRVSRLRDAGLTAGQVASLAAPIGLDLGARTPEETATSIAAEIVAQRWRGSGTRLSDLDVPVHHDVD